LYRQDKKTESPTGSTGKQWPDPAGGTGCAEGPCPSAGSIRVSLIEISIFFFLGWRGERLHPSIILVKKNDFRKRIGSTHQIVLDKI
jgi:hypothetical protein